MSITSNYFRHKRILLILSFFVLSHKLHSYEISSYFNSPQYGQNISQVIISLIDQANSNISVSAYSFDDPDIASALINAANRGVKVRMTIDSDYWNSIIDILDSHSNIEVFNDFKSKGYKEGSRQHHSKFMILDYDIISSPIKNTVITGSYNFTLSSRYNAYNNIVVIKDNPDVATMYIQEFNEEWGSTGFQFDVQNSKMRTEKRDPPPYFHMTGNFEAYFSYSDNNKISEKLVNLILNSTNVFICMYSLSSNSDIFNAIIEAIQDGKDVYGVFDGGQSDNPFSGTETLLQLTPNKFYVENDPKILHNKYIILNYSDENPSDAIVITGSYNISKNAENNNDENILIIKNNPDIARNYFRDFTFHFSKSGKSLENLSIVNVETTNLNLILGQNFSLRGENLHRVVSVFITNSSYYSTVNIISNATNTIFLSSPNVTGIFDLGLILNNGDRFLVPVKVSVFDPSITTLIVNDGAEGLLANMKIDIELFGYTNSSMPFVIVIVNGVEKFIMLYPELWYYRGSFFLDSLFQLKDISNNTPIVFKFGNTCSTNTIVLPPPRIRVDIPKNLTKNTTCKIKFIIDDPFLRKYKVSFDGNVKFINFDNTTGELYFYVSDEVSVASIFYTVDDEAGYSFSDLIEIPVVSSEEVLVYPTFAKEGEKIYIEGEFEKIFLFDKNYNNVPFVLGREDNGRVFIIPNVYSNATVLFIVIHKQNGERKIKKVVYHN